MLYSDDERQNPNMQTPSDTMGAPQSSTDPQNYNQDATQSWNVDPSILHTQGIQTDQAQLERPGDTGLNAGNDGDGLQAN